MSQRLPRDVSGLRLAALLEAFGYEVNQKKGSHLRLTTNVGGEHHVTVPDHNSLRIGTLSAILKDVAGHAALSREEIAKQLFG